VGPAGLDLGGTAAAEIALSVFAHVVATVNQRSGGVLADATGPVRAR
jgi:xanthine/CO dehydrogenase XdhC/CoxF family maturation factor